MNLHEKAGFGINRPFPTLCDLLFIVCYLHHSCVINVDDWDLVTEGAFFHIEPLLALFISTITVTCCIIIGLPIRMIPKIKTWWGRHPFVPLVTLLIGIVLLFLSVTTTVAETRMVNIDGVEQSKEIPNFIVVSTGWFVVAFSTLHFYTIPFLHWVKHSFWGKSIN